MHLYIEHLFQWFVEQELNRGVKCEELCGKKLEAIKVFAFCIKYLKKKLLEEIQNKVLGTFTDDDIEYVLTVPAIWGDKAKMFMREAASNVSSNFKWINLGWADYEFKIGWSIWKIKSEN